MRLSPRQRPDGLGKAGSVNTEPLNGIRIEGDIKMGQV